MNDQPRNSWRSSGERSHHTSSPREREFSRRQSRARQHLERVRGGAPRRPRIGAVALLAVAVSLATGALFGNPLVAAARSWIAGEPARLEVISVRGSRHLTLGEIARSTGLAPGAELASIDASEIESRLLENPWISDASAVRFPTGRVLVRVTEHSAHARIAIGDPARDFAVNAHGEPFAPADERLDPSLPRLVASFAVERDVADERLARAIALAQRLPEFELPLPSEVHISDDSDPEGFAIRLPNLRPRIVLGHGHLEARLSSLAQLLAAGLEELEQSESVDLRFADQAVLRGATSPQGAEQAAAARGRAAPSTAGPNA